MENEFFLNAGIAPLIHYDPTSWQSAATNAELNSSSDCFYNPSWEKSTDQGLHFDSALSSMVSSPAASNSNLSGESFAVRELIGRLGNIGKTSGEFFPRTSNAVAQFSPDPGFAERAARLSCFGSRSFNGRTGHLGPNGGGNEPGRCPIPPVNPKMSRVASSPSLKEHGSPPEKSRNRYADSQEESTVSEQNRNPIPINETNARKRKAVSKGKAKEFPSSSSTKIGEINDNSTAKRNKPNDGNEETGPAKPEEEPKGNDNSGDEKLPKTSQKPPEPPKDYIHVRARRGQATDSHSLAERVRREKISERMKLLQDLVPGCNKVTGKALMLDEIINYVQSLQRQVEFLSMKLASVNTRLDGNIDTLMSKDVFQPNNSMPHPIFPLDSSAPSIFGHQPQQNQALHCNISNGTHCPIDTVDASLCQNLGMQLPQLSGFGDILSQYPTFGEDDLHSIVQMGFGQNPNRGASLQPQSIHGPNQVAHMKIEL